MPLNRDNRVQLMLTADEVSLLITSLDRSKSYWTARMDRAYSVINYRYSQSVLKECNDLEEKIINILSE